MKQLLTKNEYLYLFFVEKAVGEGFEPSYGDSIIDRSACKLVVYPSINYLFLIPCRRD